jgi:hypothetical protein
MKKYNFFSCEGTSRRNLHQKEQDKVYRKKISNKKSFIIKP